MSDSLYILFIDGNEQERRYYVQRLLTSSPDFVVIEAASGHFALDLCEGCSMDCVVLELDLPDMSGFEVLIKLVPFVRFPDLPVVVLTRLTNLDLHELALVNGAQAAFHKPHTSADLLERSIRKAVATVRKDHKRNDDVWL